MILRFLIINLTLFISINGYANNDPTREHARLVGQTFYESVQILMKLEEKAVDPAYTKLINMLINKAYANPTGSCLLSGWMGKLEGNRCRPNSIEYKNAKSECNAPHSSPCNPQYFGTGLCIDTSKAGVRWTNACYNAFLKKNNFSDGDYEKLGNEIMKDKSINLTTVVAESKRMCGAIAKKDNDINDCNKITDLYTKIIRHEHNNPNTTPKITLLDERKNNLAGKLEKKTPTNHPLKKARDQASCSPIDHSKKTGDVVYQQGASGSCYAYAAAQVMSYNPDMPNGYPKNDPRRISPLATAIQHAHFRGKSSKGNDFKNYGEYKSSDLAMDGGRITLAMEAANNFGVCSGSLWGGINELEDEKHYSELIEVYNQYDRERKMNPGCAENALNVMLGHTFPLFSEQYIQYMEKKIEKENKTLTPEDRENYHAVLSERFKPLLEQSKNLDDFLFSVVDEQCKTQIKKIDQNGIKRELELGRTPPWAKKIYDQAYTNTTQDKVLNDLYKTLEDGYIEGFGYITSGLIKPKVDKNNKHGFHASIAVGRGFLEKKDLPPGSKEGCYILVKNSWGANWPEMNKESSRFSKAPNQVGIYDKEKPGYFWAHEQDFVNYSMSSTHIER